MVYKFGSFELNAEERFLSFEGKLVPLPPKALDTLLVLVRSSGHLVTKQELMDQVWPESFVEESNLANNICLLRRVLSDRGGQRYIETVPRRGYRFLASPSEETSGSQIEIPAERLSSNDSWRSYGNPLSLPFSTEALSDIAYMAALKGALSARVHGEEPSGPWLQSGPKAIAILPFKYIGGAHEDAELGLAIADAVITRLSNVRGLTVRPTSAVLRYSERDKDAIEAGRELNVHSVIDGCVQTSGDRIRSTVQLVSVKDGAPLWAQRFEEPLTDLFAAQDGMSHQVAEALLAHLTE